MIIILSSRCGRREEKAKERGKGKLQGPDLKFHLKVAKSLDKKNIK